MPRQLFGYGRSDRSSKLIRGLGSEAAAGFRSRRGRYREPTPVIPHYAPFASYKATGFHQPCRRRGGGLAAGGERAAAGGLRAAADVPPGPEGNPPYRRRKGVRSASDFVRLIAPQRRHGDAGGRGERAGGDRQRDQDRPDHALYRSGRLALVYRFGREGLHANDQRSGRRQWSQDQPDQCRRRLPAVANRQRDAQADRSGPRRLYFRFDWDAHSGLGRKISQRAKNSAAVHRERRLPLGQLQGDPLLDRRPRPELPTGSASLYPTYSPAGS